MTLQDTTMFISRASSGVGLEIAMKAATDGVNVALMATTAEPHPKLPGTIYTAAQEIERLIPVSLMPLGKEIVPTDQPFVAAAR